MEAFHINIPQTTLDDLHARLARTRWPDEIDGAGWDYGTNLGYLKELVTYWQHSFDWRAQEAKLNQFAQFKTTIDGLDIHFIHARGKGSNPTPIVISHGWPGSFFEIVKLIPLLTDPAAHGGDPEASFDVVIPSLPGYGFSERPHTRGWTLENTADIFAKLMTDVLGYERFAAAGGDFGAIVTQHLAQRHADKLIGIHLTYIGHYESIPDEAELSEAEQHYQQALQYFTWSEGAYFMIQSTKPQSLAYGLNDSPVGLAAWITEKFYTWTDSNGQIERSISKDELLTNITIYWVTETINSSIRTYYESTPQTLERLPDAPAAFAVFPKDLNPPPREWVERRVDLQHWTEMPRGGHFAALEEPKLLAADLQAFFGKLKRKSA